MLSASFKGRFLFSYCWSELNGTLVAGKGNVSPLTSYSQLERALGVKKREASVLLKARFLEKVECSRERAGEDPGSHVLSLCPGRACRNDFTFLAAYGSHSNRAQHCLYEPQPLCALPPFSLLPGYLIKIYCIIFEHKTYVSAPHPCLEKARTPLKSDSFLKHWYLGLAR